jgi:hypothetical protein
MSWCCGTRGSTCQTSRGPCRFSGARRHRLRRSVIRALGLRPPVWTILPVAAVLASGCRGDSLADIPHEWRLHEVARVGAIDRGDYALPDVAALAVSSSGVIYVASRMDSSIRLFDESGSYITTLGGRGRGPGEFDWLYQIGVRGDTLWAADMQLRRLTFFDISTGDVVRVDERVGHLAYVEPHRIPMLRAIAPNGAHVLFPAVLSRWAQRDTVVPLIVFDAERATAVTLGHVTVPHPSITIAEGSRRTYIAQPFDDRTLYGVSPAGDKVVFVDRSESELPPSRYRVASVNISGDTAWSRTYRVTPTEISEAAIDAARKRVRGAAGPAERQAMAGLHIPDHHPPVTAVVVADDGAIWLRGQDTRADSVTWTILSEEGAEAGRVKSSSRWQPRVIRGRRVYGVETGEMDVPYVSVHELHRVR